MTKEPYPYRATDKLNHRHSYGPWTRYSKTLEYRVCNGCGANQEKGR